MTPWRKILKLFCGGQELKSDQDYYIFSIKKKAYKLYFFIVAYVIIITYYDHYCNSLPGCTMLRKHVKLHTAAVCCDNCMIGNKLLLDICK